MARQSFPGHRAQGDGGQLLVPPAPDLRQRCHSADPCEDEAGNHEAEWIGPAIGPKSVGIQGVRGKNLRLRMRRWKHGAK